MEKKLKLLFDYQRYENSPRLAKLISQTEERTSRRQLSDDELNYVMAGVSLPSPELSRTDETKHDE